MTWDHQRRVEVLETLASLLGFAARLTAFADGRMPDVVRLRLPGRGLFIGDAKNTETPGGAATATRLSRYFRWARAHTAGGSLTVIALCFGRAAESNAWLATLKLLGREHGLRVVSRSALRLAPGCAVLVSVVALSEAP